MTHYTLTFHKDVAIDYDNGYNWYENQQSGLGEKFLAAINNRIKEILLNPEAYSAKSKPGYRESLVNRFPYSIVYRIYKKEGRILITSVHHHKKHPRLKYRK